MVCRASLAFASPALNRRIAQPKHRCDQPGRSPPLRRSSRRLPEAETAETAPNMRDPRHPAARRSCRGLLRRSINLVQGEEGTMSPEQKALLTADGAGTRARDTRPQGDRAQLDGLLPDHRHLRRASCVRATNSRTVAGGRTRSTSPAALLASHWGWWTRLLGSGTTRSGASGRWPPNGWNSTARPCQLHRPSPRDQHQVRGNRRLAPARGEEAVRA